MCKLWWKIRVMMVLAAVVIGLSPAVFSCPVHGEKAQGVKYDPQFGNVLEAARAQHRTQRWLDSVIRVEAPVTDAMFQQLADAGFQCRSVIVAGDGSAIMTGRIRVRDADQLIALPFVKSIEGGGRGGPKRTQGLK